MIHFKDALINLWLKPLLFMARRQNRHFISALKKEMEQCSKFSDFFFSVKRRPKYAKQVIVNEHESAINLQTAIVIQGPLVTEDNFTLETIRLYGRLFPGVLVIVSTWENEDSNSIQRIQRENNCRVILNQYPHHSGLLNLNYQITTTLAGVEEAKRLGKKYVFKSRADFRFYKKGLLEYLYLLITTFPMGCDEEVQKYRIIGGAGRMNCIFRPFWLTDQFNYGYVDDMLRYWNYPIKSIDLKPNELCRLVESEHYSWNERTKRQLSVETELLLNYIQSVEGSRPDISVSNYWEIIKKRFIVVSRQDLEYYWCKYPTRFDESFSDSSYREDDSPERMYSYNWDYAQWLRLYNGILQYKKEYELFAEKNKY